MLIEISTKANSHIILVLSIRFIRINVISNQPYWLQGLLYIHVEYLSHLKFEIKIMYMHFIMHMCYLELQKPLLAFYKETSMVGNFCQRYLSRMAI
jgi:hypothetical protein